MRGILVSMGKRDSLFKSMSQEKDHLLRSETSTTYKRYRNLIINLLKQSKKNYYSLYFIENQKCEKNLGWYTRY